MVTKVYYSYEQIHKCIQDSSSKILQDGKPDYIIGIAGGGLIPSRILRTYLKAPIQTIGLCLYDDTVDKAMDKVTRLQWFDNAEILKDKVVLIVDEIDDSRKTLIYAVEEIRKMQPKEIRVFVIHNKLKSKHGELPTDVKYYAGANVEDNWIVYPWEAIDIEEHYSHSTDK